MVRDECDIIELFIKHNVDVVDAIYILDHFSTDGTTQIINELIKQGYPVKLFRARDTTFNQSAEVSALVQEVARSKEYGFIIPLDADEFLPFLPKPEFGDFLASRISLSESGYMKWKTFCPTSMNYFEVDNPVATEFSARSHEPDEFRKVVIGNVLAQDCMVSEGNHRVRLRFWRARSKSLALELQHVPIRSSEQAVKKSLMSHFAISASPGRRRRESTHWGRMVASIRENNYRLDLSALQGIALSYSSPSLYENNADSPTMTTDRLELSSDHSIEMKSMTRINLLSNLDTFMENLLSTNILLHRRGYPWDQFRHKVDQFLR